ncbi:hypothetical protein JOF56_001878 [Kibdelosporangium banguiense]|uniref:Uncharacterized protein n=1 Tax=Kibdelosporangium banguiense TaxID=1365924 RepID=A0ABS4TAQ7_9PSEU|nr:hypothetical protein [Kibdelosporangium banguiense]
MKDPRCGPSPQHEVLEDGTWYDRTPLLLVPTTPVIETIHLNSVVQPGGRTSLLSSLFKAVAK